MPSKFDVERGAFLAAVKAGDLTAVRRALNSDKAREIVNRAYSKHSTALHMAAASGNSEIVEALLGADVYTDINETISVSVGNQEITALHIAAEAGNHEVVRLLLNSNRYHAINNLNSRNETALHLAANINLGFNASGMERQVSNDNRLKCIQHLLGSDKFTMANASNANFQTSSGNTALHYAARHHNAPELITTLLSSPKITDETINKQTDNAKETILHIARYKRRATGNTSEDDEFRKQQAEVVRIILENPHFTARDKKDFQGKTALDYEADYGSHMNVYMMGLLLSTRQKVQSRFKRGGVGFIVGAAIGAILCATPVLGQAALLLGVTALAAGVILTVSLAIISFVITYFANPYPLYKSLPEPTKPTTSGTKGITSRVRIRAIEDKRRAHARSPARRPNHSPQSTSGKKPPEPNGGAPNP